MRDEADAIRSCIAQTTAIIAELQAMEDQDEVHDSVLAAKDAKRGEESKLLPLHEVIAKALEEMESQGYNVEMLDAYVALYSEEFNLFCWVQFYNHGSSMPRLCPYGDRVLEMTKLCYVCDCYTDHELFSLMYECVVLEICDLVYGWQINRCRIWVTITKDQRLIAELEALGQRADVLKSLEYMRVMVALNSARVGVLEQILCWKHEKCQSLPKL
ncbi:hypothetical protein Tco_0040970 [Tanacetum coccineum]